MAETRVTRNRPRRRIARTLVSASARFNYKRALKRLVGIPYIKLTEFPRAGGNSIRDVMGDALQLPVPRFSRMPITFAAIAHNHDHRLLTDCDVIYVLRDGRDVFLSHFEKTMTGFLDGSPSLRKRFKSIHPSIAPLERAGAGRAEMDNKDFYAEWTVRSIGARVNWGQNVAPWLAPDLPRIVRIRYEGMRSDPEATLTRAANMLADRPVLEETIRFAVTRNSFLARTGRRAGEIEPRSTKRQGIAGAWKKQMPEPLIRRFRADFGEILERAGYEV